MIVATLILLNLCWTISSPQRYFEGNWTWVGGNKLSSQAPNYGTRGVPASSNWPGKNIPHHNFKTDGVIGSRYQATYDTDAVNHVLYMYGGKVFDGIGPYHSDLWSYDMKTGLWTWLGGPTSPSLAGSYGQFGVASENNHPSSRYECALSYHNQTNSVFLFGGATNGTCMFNQ
jgi:hypothetical protein